MLPSQRYIDLISVIFTQATSLFSTRLRAIAGPSPLEAVVRMILACDLESGTIRVRVSQCIPRHPFPGGLTHSVSYPGAGYNVIVIIQPFQEVLPVLEPLNAFFERGSGDL